MNSDYPDPNAYPIELPRLSDEAVVEIRSFIEHVLDQFDIHYGSQVHRFYQDRAQHNMRRPPPRTHDDPPF